MNRIAISLLAGVAAIGFVSSTYAADLIVEAPYVAPGVVDVSGNWDGAYVGVFGGYGWGTLDHQPTGGPCFPDGCDIGMDGWLLGVTAGANFTVGSGFVLGVAGDIAWSNIEGSENPVELGGDLIVGGVDWEGSVRGVAGFDAGAFMPYVTAGFAFAHAWHEADYGDGGADATHMGWTAGVGVQVAVADNVSLDLQYRHSWYGEEEYEMNDANIPNPIFGLSTDRITAGLNIRF